MDVALAACATQWLTHGALVLRAEIEAIAIVVRRPCHRHPSEPGRHSCELGTSFILSLPKSSAPYTAERTMKHRFDESRRRLLKKVSLGVALAPVAAAIEFGE